MTESIVIDLEAAPFTASVWSLPAFTRWHILIRLEKNIQVRREELFHG